LKFELISLFLKIYCILRHPIVIFSDKGCTRQEQDSNDELRDSDQNADPASLISDVG